jgi:hypothetical protein
MASPRRHTPLRGRRAEMCGATAAGISPCPASRGGQGHFNIEQRLEKRRHRNVDAHQTSKKPCFHWRPEPHHIEAVFGVGDSVSDQRAPRRMFPAPILQGSGPEHSGIIAVGRGRHPSK